MLYLFILIFLAYENKMHSRVVQRQCLSVAPWAVKLPQKIRSISNGKPWHMPTPTPNSFSVPYTIENGFFDPKILRYIEWHFI